ncbi:MAG: ATPase [Clostridia bacterium]|nr:ATPase [Clostridia bacterium]
MRENAERTRPDSGESDLFEMLDKLEATVSHARSLPFSDSCLVDREEVLVLISLIRDSLPAEIQQAKWLLGQNRQLVAEARKEAENIVREAETRMTAMIDEHEITLQARQAAAHTIETANQSARQIRNGALDYAKRLLTGVEDNLTGVLVTIQKNKKELS